MFGGLFGGEKKPQGPRENLGGNSEAIPDQKLGTTNEEAEIIGKNRSRRETLENLIIEVENDRNHQRYGELESLRKELRSME